MEHNRLEFGLVLRRQECTKSVGGSGDLGNVHLYVKTIACLSAATGVKPSRLYFPISKTILECAGRAPIVS